MTRRQFLPVSTQGKGYKIYIDDIHKVHQRIHKKTPNIPKYNE